MSRVLSALGTIRGRMVIAGAAIAAGLVAIAVIGIGALSTIGATIGSELTLLQRVSSLSSGLTATVSDEIRNAEQYLAARDPETERQFREAAAGVYDLQRGLAGIGELGPNERRAAAAILSVWPSASQVLSSSACTEPFAGSCASAARIGGSRESSRSSGW